MIDRPTVRRLLALVVLGCTAVPGRAGSLSAGARYVAMGSSYAAGPGVGRYDRASGSCARSFSNYARQVAARHRLALTDVSCSGATTADILSERQGGFPSQIAAVTRATRLVTILIGGNDVHYVGDLAARACRADGNARCAPTPDAEKERLHRALPARLAAVIAAVRQRAPEARIIMVGYLPTIAGGRGCAGLPLPAEDAAAVERDAARVEGAIEHAAALAHVAVVPAAGIGVRHGACATEPFITGAHPPVPTGGWSRAAPFHPTQAGMDAVAKAVEAVLG